MASVNISHIGNNAKANVNDCDTIIDDDKTRNCVSDAKKSKFNTPSDLETVKTEDNKEFKFSLEPTLENMQVIYFIAYLVYYVKTKLDMRISINEYSIV